MAKSHTWGKKMVCNCNTIINKVICLIKQLIYGFIWFLYIVFLKFSMDLYLMSNFQLYLISLSSIGKISERRVSSNTPFYLTMQWMSEPVEGGGRSKILGMQALMEGLNGLNLPPPLNSDRVNVYAKYWGYKIIPLLLPQFRRPCICLSNTYYKRKMTWGLQCQSVVRCQERHYFLR